MHVPFDYWAGIAAQGTGAGSRTATGSCTGASSGSCTGASSKASADLGQASSDPGASTRADRRAYTPAKASGQA